MHPSSLLSYYPTYALLDEIVSYGNYNDLTIFLDLKNSLQTTYMEHAIVNIVAMSKQASKLDTSIFSSLLSFLSFHKIYGMKRGINTRFIIFFESGRSFYHLNIDKSYKISRKIDSLYGLDKEDRDLFFKVLQANFQLIESACNKIPNIKVIRLPNLEADFVPYYVITRKLIKETERSANIVYSNDHDLWQCLNPNTFIFSKYAKVKKIIKTGGVMKRFLKRETDIPDEYLPLAMSIIGDPGDDVTGIDKVGPVAFLKCFDEFIVLTGDMETIYKKVEKGACLFDVIPKTIVNKKLEKIINKEMKDKTISNNLRLVSFELISRALDNPSKTEMITKRQIIEKMFLEEKQTPSCESMKKALEMNGVMLEDSSIELLYI